MDSKKNQVSTVVENADAICQKILEESDYQSSDIVARAQKEAGRILSEAKDDTEKKKDTILKQLDIDLIKIKEKVFSTLNIEKKKIELKEKTEFIGQILNNVRQKAESFRSASGYRNFLKSATVEGVGIIDKEEIDVFYSGIDEKVFSGEFIAEIQNACRDKYNRNFSLQFKRYDSSDVGILLQSRDGNLIFDNTFLARFKRKYEEIYMELLKSS
jgi:vacuolar-type H+-ATPase subunit E/Vma4